MLLEVLEKSLNFTHTCLYEPCHCLEQLYSCIACLNIWCLVKTLKTFFVYFLSAFVSMHMWWLAVISCALHTLATEENVGNIPVCACCNHFPFTWNEFYHNTKPNNCEYSHKVQVFQGKISGILPIDIMKNIKYGCSV